MIQLMAIHFYLMEFKSIIKAHDSNPWQIIKSPLLHGAIKAQFSLAILKAQFTLTISKSPVSLAISKSPIYIGIILKAQEY